MRGGRVMNATAERPGLARGLGEDMRRQRRAIAARRRRQFVTLGRLAAWLGFGGAVLSQAALLAGGYLLVDDAPNALRNAGIAGGVALAGAVVMVPARRAATRAQS